MYNGINEMIDDLMEHISLENNVLFPRALSGNKKPGGASAYRAYNIRERRPGKRQRHPATRLAHARHTFLTDKQPAQPQRDKPQRRDDQRLPGIFFQRQQHQHEDEERHAHPAHQLAQRHLVDRLLMQVWTLLAVHRGTSRG